MMGTGVGLVRREGSSARPLAALLAAALLGAGPGTATAQLQSVGPDVNPPDPLGWLDAWSPLVEVGDLPRHLPGARAVLPEPLFRPLPRAGLFWTAGNPAGLADEVPGSRTELAAGISGRSGPYRRPLDPAEESSTGAGGLAWGPLGANGAGIGRVTAGASGREGDHANVVQPYSSAPLAILDTIGAARTRTSARVEGAGGWRTGKVSFGLGLGYLAHKMETDGSPVPVSSRSTRPGATAGLAYGDSDGLRAGVHARWQQATHSVNIFSVAAPSRVYELLGYDEPVAFNLSGQFYGQRVEEDSWAAGGSLAGVTSGLRWVATARVEGHETRRFDNNSNNPQVDRWEAEGVSLALAGRSTLWGGAEAVAELRYRSVDGGARKPSLEGEVFTGEERRLSGAGELRFGLGPRWTAAARLAVARESRTRRDLLVGIRSEVSAWETGLGASLVRVLPGGGRIGGGLAVSHYVPSGAIPAPGAVNQVYERWISGENLLAGVEAWSWSGRLGARLPLSGAADLVVRGGYGSASPGETGGGTVLTDPPEGSRRRWEASLGVVLGGR